MQDFATIHRITSASEASQVLLDPWGPASSSFVTTWCSLHWLPLGWNHVKSRMLLAARTIMTIPYGRCGISMDFWSVTLPWFLPHFPITNEDKKTHPPARSSRPVCWDRCTRVWTSASHGSCRRLPGRSWVGCPQFCLSILGGKYGAGWWCNNHLETYESQWEGWQPIYEMENTNMFETTNQGVAFLLWESSQHVTTNMGISPTKKGRPQLMDFDNPT